MLPVPYTSSVGVGKKSESISHRPFFSCLLKSCKQALALLLITSVFNSTSCLGMKVGSESSDDDQALLSARVAPPKFEEDDVELSAPDGRYQDTILDTEAILSSSVSINKNYTDAFREDLREYRSCSSTAQSISTLIVGLLTCLPQIAVALAVGDYYGSRAFGVFLVGLTFVTQTTIAGWITNEFIEDTKDLVQQAREESRGRGLCSLQTLNIFKFGVSAFVLGTLSSCGDVYKAYEYNTIKELSIITFAFDVLTRTLGLYKAFSNLKLKNPCRSSSREEKAKELGESYIDLSTRYFLASCKQLGKDVVLEDLRDKGSPDEILSYMAEKSALQGVNESTLMLSKKFGKGWPRYLTMGTSLVFPVASGTFNLVMSYKGYSLLVDNVYLDSTLAVVSILPPACLSVYVILKAANGVFDKIYYWRNGLLNNDYFSVMHPNYNRVFIAGSLLVGGVSSALGYAIIRDNMDDTVFEPVSGLVASVGVVAGFIFESYTILQITKKYFEIILRARDTTKYRLFEVLRKLNQVKDHIAGAGLDSVREFIAGIKPDNDDDSFN